MSRRAALLAEMGIAPIWKLRSKETPVEVPVRGWIPLKAAVSGCTKCGLHKTRAQTVFGVGDENADWMLVGEAPGAEEDRLGDPFVGQAGKLLDNMLAAIGLSRRSNVYIANVLKCRPPGNRNPSPEEVEKCTPYLLEQIELIKPKLILRGRVHRYAGVPLIVTYHPAYLLRTLEDKAKAWDDLVFARRTMQSL